MKFTDKDQDLIYIDTNLFTFVIKGKPVHPDIMQLYPARDNNLKARLELNPVGCQVKSFCYYDPSCGLKIGDEIALQVYPFFYEQQNYLVFIEGKNNQKIDFYHENKSIREAVTSYPGKDNQLMGIINFQN